VQVAGAAAALLPLSLGRLLPLLRRCSAPSFGMVAIIARISSAADERSKSKNR
jgi:hypothetical protein